MDIKIKVEISKIENKTNISIKMISYFLGKNQTDILLFKLIRKKKDAITNTNMEEKIAL